MHLNAMLCILQSIVKVVQEHAGMTTLHLDSLPVPWDVMHRYALGRPQGYRFLSLLFSSAGL